MLVLNKPSEFARLQWRNLSVESYSSYFALLVESVDARAFSLFLVFARLIKLITHAELACKFITFGRQVGIKILTSRIFALIIRLIKTFAIVAMLSPKPSVSSILSEIALVVVRVVWILVGPTTRPSEIRITIGRIVALTAHSSALSRLIGVQECAGTLGKFIASISKFTYLLGSLLHRIHYVNSESNYIILINLNVRLI